eukprot:7497350-Pyramimonas_sp.AAC.1
MAPHFDNGTASNLEKTASFENECTRRQDENYILKPTRFLPRKQGNIQAHAKRPHKPTDLSD